MRLTLVLVVPEESGLHHWGGSAPSNSPEYLSQEEVINKVASLLSNLIAGPKRRTQGRDSPSSLNPLPDSSVLS